MTAGKICTRIIATAAPEENIRQAAHRMEENDVGTLVVMEGDKARGLLTDRDIVLRAIARDLDLGETPVSEIMSTPVHSVEESTPIEDVLSKMGAVGTRRLVVTDKKERVVGILALDDVLDVLVEEGDAVGRLLGKQKPRVTA